MKETDPGGDRGPTESVKRGGGGERGEGGVDLVEGEGGTEEDLTEVSVSDTPHR